MELPGVLLAGVASIGLGVVLGPEAPLMALGGGIGFLTIRALRNDSAPAVGQLLSSAGMFAGLSFLFGSPIIAAVILTEAAGLSRQTMPLVVIPGLLAAGIGSLTSIGMNHWTGLDSSNISLGGFRGGPVFPALFLGAAAGLMAGQLPGFEISPAVAVGIGAAVAAVLRLPLAAVILASIMAVKAGEGAMPLIIVGVATAYLTTLYLDGVSWIGTRGDDSPEPAAAGPGP